MKNIVVTGVSTGIGYATVATLLKRGHRLFGSVRTREDAGRLSAEMGERFTPLVFDVRDGPAIEAAVGIVQRATGDDGLACLINNAGVVLPGPLLFTSLDDVRTQFEVNLIGLLNVTQNFAPLLGARKDCPFPPGRIVNISSMSGRIAYPFMGIYAATKHGLEAISDSLRRELIMYGIDVVVVQPGTTRTPIQHKYASQVEEFRTTDYGALFAGLEEQLEERERSGLPVEKVVDAIVAAVEKERPKTRYAVPRKWLTSWMLPRLLPDRWLDRLVAGQLGMKDPSKKKDT